MVYLALQGKTFKVRQMFGTKNSWDKERKEEVHAKQNFQINWVPKTQSGREYKVLVEQCSRICEENAHEAERVKKLFVDTPVKLKEKVNFYKF